MISDNSDRHGIVLLLVVVEVCVDYISQDTNTYYYIHELEKLIRDKERSKTHKNTCKKGIHTSSR